MAYGDDPGIERCPLSASQNSAFADIANSLNPANYRLVDTVERAAHDERLAYACRFLQTGGQSSFELATDLLAEIGHDYELDPEKVQEAMMRHWTRTLVDKE